MENVYKKVENELQTLSVEEKEELLNKLRSGVDAIDKELVSLLSKRTKHSIMIGRIKHSIGLATYAPEREKFINQRIGTYAEEPLRKEAVMRIYERILDESRAIQREEATKGNLYNLFSGGGKVSLRNLLSKKEFLIIVSFFILVLSIFSYIIFSPNYYPGDSPKIIKISKGESLDFLAKNLYNEEMISSKGNFKLAAYLYGATKRLKAARYYVPNGLSYLSLLDLFVSDKGDALKEISLYGGISTKGLCLRLQSEKIANADSLFLLIKNKNFLSRLNFQQVSLEGYLLPQEYDFYENSSAEEIVEAMFRSFQKFFVDSLKVQAKKIGLSEHEVVTLASIVDGETNKKEEMSRIAGVYLNRLHGGMKLQADPTLQYLQTNRWKRLNGNDLRIDSKYNTYKYFGLPPGPINNPGKDALFAALYAENHNYLFFVADTKGGHLFSHNFFQHKKLAQEYYKWLNRQ
ncbi:MAG: endolytic transglycosylase MltG [Ignavibacteriaceae bacterium]